MWPGQLVQNLYVVVFSLLNKCFMILYIQILKKREKEKKSKQLSHKGFSWTDCVF